MTTRPTNKPRRRLACSLFAAAALAVAAAPASADLDYLPPDAAHGDWAEQFYAGPSTVAGFLVRVGDIDNFSTGWDLAYRPFFGRPARPFDEVLNQPDDADGTDLARWPILDTDIPDSDRGITLSGSFFTLEDVTSARLVFFAARLEKKPVAVSATLNDVPAPFIADALAAADIPLGQGRLISLAVPEEHLADLSLGTFRLTLSHDREADTPFALDFVSCYLNPKPLAERATTGLTGRVIDRTDGVPLSGMTVEAAGYTTQTDDSGHFAFPQLPAGHTIVHLGSGDRRVSHALDLPGGRTHQRVLAY
ncbi:MAG: carboxypeptidase-like regulatory domain-containing protein [Planctomycetota bacterium]